MAGNMMVQGPAKNVFGKSAKAGRAFGTMPKNMNIRSVTKSHASAAKAGTSKPLPSFPQTGAGVATAGIGGKVFAK